MATSMDEVPDNAVIAAEEILKRYRGELARLEGTKRGLEAKIAATKAQIEAAEQFVEVTKKIAAKKTT